ncbi:MULTISPECIES: bifunctional tetrahydrofolate synthase/dihydrofolate synthase [Ectothiorhodospira]|uniref:Dihydrofolate synthase/folylpolyglutamate synthase n=1 Tax=Ectothiorhodospira marina TaxID=1396821 RepID=A0A1H7NDB3_9GAMM|nr:MULTISPECIES: bifunctional tetrahydrofolate synthase/dihydrofolate synthase [Ectothiorhodospira]MCG5515829.1 bifunctional tetrahydrofolate synthase/dihydrofolate synthase [Ectothiorhodospira sp. 9100]MCG5518915.1 bifunctional tetrahydrofolate synthase/dihydrofolate synthase [Ectothiorhodospira sp. 9905]SEL21562.1 dihydrofolate synthase / folylpolyglutamate synthase [Ectothiorhodospira marina]
MSETDVPPPRFDSLADWLDWQERFHIRPIDLGLDRVGRVADLMGLRPASAPVITVGGTNGKGSTVAFLEAIYRAAGYRVGVYTSPHLLRYNERIRLAGVPVEDGLLCEAFAAVDRARDTISLSYFEFGTLAALWLFRRQAMDVILLEVGLGGRLDAVNILDAHVAVVTSVGIDHQSWLGEDREAIGFEKAGIFRSEQPAVCGDMNPPSRLLEHAANLNTPLALAGSDFHVGPVSDDGVWDYHGMGMTLPSLPPPGLAGSIQRGNAATALTAALLLEDQVPLTEQAVREGIAQAQLMGRYQCLRQAPAVWVDVAHNPQGACTLGAHLADAPVEGRTLAVMAVMADKDVPGILEPLRPLMDAWYLGALDLPRALAPEALAAHLEGEAPVHIASSVVEACQAALLQAGPADRIIVFGSFHTVAAVLQAPFPWVDTTLKSA